MAIPLPPTIARFIDASNARDLDATGIDQRGGQAVVRATLAGNFPGSPVELDYEFTLVDDAIESLKIHP